MRKTPLPRHTLKVMTYNIHKGFSHFNRRLVVHDIRERLHEVGDDLCFLQEVQGAHRKHAERHESWPDSGQHEFLAADGVHSAYGMNAVYDHGHHGNAVLSRFPIVSFENMDISHHRLEQRGLLHCEIAVAGWDTKVHCLNVHLGLWGRSRRFQLESLCERVCAAVPEGDPIIVAGDFNDWSRQASSMLRRELGLEEVFEQSGGRPAKSFPALLPMLTLDRIYVRGFEVDTAHRMVGAEWSKLSDHVALLATLTR